MRTAHALAIVALMGTGAGAAAQQNASLTERFDLGRRSARHNLPERLDEISGLAFSPDGRLFAHDDERAWVHELDPESGEVGKRFMFGDQTARDDFEGIAIVGERFFLVSSRGLLYESREGADREEMPYRVTDLGIGAHCEVEGLDYLAAVDELLVLCKNATPDRGDVVIHRIPVAPGVERPAPLRVARRQLSAFGLEPEFHGSGIAYDPTVGTLVLAAAQEEVLIEVTLEGRVLAAARLESRRHAQPEGLAIGPGGTLYIADERNGSPPRVTMYHPRSASR